MAEGKMKYQNTELFAHSMDESDTLKAYRTQFHIPPASKGGDMLYFAGNSLGLQPRKAREYINQELDDWARLGVEGHFHGKHPWLPYHENLTEMTARLVGAKPIEVVVMNTLTVNLHLMMVSFYRPTPKRHRILVEGGAFPSDQYAVASQVKFHGHQPHESIVELWPRKGEATLRTEDIVAKIAELGESLSLVMLGNVNYLTGQAFDMQALSEAAHKAGALAGFNLAHGAGNLLLNLHEWNVDFAVWCSYKYLNAGPGNLAGCFVHERHAREWQLPRFAGWWGHNKKTRFQMGSEFDPLPGAEGWQLSNPPIFQLAALRASLEIFDAATMTEIRKKGDRLTGYLEFLLDELPAGYCTITTPRDVAQRGSQLSLRLRGNPKELLKDLADKGVICDFREPDVIRVAPAPLYNRFMDVYRLVKILGEHAHA
ncbi:MAG: kynureninase [Deltaproteobacteria bacterium]|nr:kynureninase [Deltaproteobacteria bacterium]